MVQFQQSSWLKDSKIKAVDSKAWVIANKKTQSETEALEPQHNLIQLQKFKSRLLTADHGFYCWGIDFSLDA